MRAVLSVLTATMIFLVSGRLDAGTTGKLSGRVLDADGNQPLMGVNVYLENTSLGGITDTDGYFFVLNIPPGSYTVIFRYMGYVTRKVENVRINTDLTTVVSIVLAKTIIAGEEVTIVAQRPVIQKDITSTSSRVTAENMAILPIETISQVVNLQAGVIDGHFRGGRLDEVAYMIDGIMVNDAYQGGQMINVEPNSVAEVEIISGTFNAEYGQVMSGVVNIVTKEPEQKLSGEISAYGGSYFSNRSIPFVGKTGLGEKREDFYEEDISHFELANISDVYDVQTILSGPVYSNKLLFFTSLRYANDDGYLYGKRIFLPSDSSYLPFYAENWRIEANGDGKYVPMNRSKRLNAHIKFVAKPVANQKITYEFSHENAQSQIYEHNYKYNPDGLPVNYNKSYSHMIHYDWVLNKNGFINIKAASLEKNYSKYLYSNPYDPRYVPSTRFGIGSGPHFYMAGTDMNHSFRTMKTAILKSDVTYQVDRYNQIKAGAELKQHDLYVREFEVVVDRITDWKPQPVSEESPTYIEFGKNPLEFSAYIQDKIEWSYFITNIGLRYDWFQPDGWFPSDLMNPTLSPKIKASTKSQLSPRFGIALPLTEMSVLHLSYGLFFQVPAFNYLYLNPLFRIPVGSSATLGNTDLKPQKTTNYELGLQHAFTNNVAANLTIYYKDIRNLLGMEVYTLLPTFDRYARYVNRDYGQVFGFTASVDVRSRLFEVTCDYTFQLAEGNSSDPRDVYVKSQTKPPTEINKQLVYLNWDRTHSLNLTGTVHYKNLWSLGLIGKFGTGFPYTPQFEGYYPSKENTERMPYFINFDLTFAKTIKVGSVKAVFFTNIYNLFDIANQIRIFKDTGRADYSIYEDYYTDDMIRSVNTVHDYYYRPHYYSQPRSVVAGLKVDF